MWKPINPAVPVTNIVIDKKALKKTLSHRLDNNKNLIHKLQKITGLEIFSKLQNDL